MSLPPLDDADTSERSAGALRRTPLGVGAKALYGAGGLIDGLTGAALTYFLLFYLTAVCGLSGALAGASSMLALTVDAIADPAIGLWSDGARSRLGRRVPFLLASPILIAVLFVLLFSIPSGVKGVALFLAATLFSIALRFAMSLFTLPYFAVGAELTDDYNARSSIAAYRICFQMLGAFCAIVLGLGVFMAGPNGILHRQAYPPFAWSCAALIAVVGLVTAFAVKAQLPRLHGAGPRAPASPARVVREIGEVLRNRSFLILFGTVVVFFVAQGAQGALAIYVNRYFWGLPTGAVQLVIVTATLGPFVGAPLNAWLARLIEKRALTMINLGVFALSMGWPPLARMAGLLPPPGGPLVVVLCTNGLVGGACLVGAAIGFQSMMADAADEHELLFGVRREGLFFSGLTLALKAASGIGGFVAGSALDLIHFPSDIAGQSAAVALSPNVVRSLGLIAGPLPAAITLLSPLVLLGYTLSRREHARVLAALAIRKA